MPDAIVTQGLTKEYAGNILAVDHLSFTVRQGEIFGFLGLNGAGKTTTIKMLSTLISPTSGSAEILGFDVTKEGLRVREKLAVVQQQESYDRNLTVEASLRLYASLWSVPKAESVVRIESLLKEFDLEELKKRKIRWLSFGQRRRLQVAREFLHDSSILILDEPTVGMDVLARHAFLDFCKKISSSGRTIFYTTHIISEAEYLCDRVALIHKGKIAALDSPKELKKRYGDVKSVLVSIRNPSEIQRLSKLFDELKIERQEVTKDSTELRLVSSDPFKLASEVSRLLEQSGFGQESISIVEPSLEDVMVRLVRSEEPS